MDNSHDSAVNPELSYTQSVLQQLLMQARKLQFIADWLDRREARRESQKLRARYKKGLGEAKKRNAPPNELNAIQGQYHTEYDLIWHPIYARDSDKLIARARKYGVQVPAMPVSYTDDEDNWYQGVTGEWILTSEAEERLRREIKPEKRQSDDEFRKWVTLAISIAAFVLALASLTKKDKQPDRCPRNYYRSDSGECVFALQKSPTSQPQPGALPLPSVQSKKPSPVQPKTGRTSGWAASEATLGPHSCRRTHQSAHEARAASSGVAKDPSEMERWPTVM